MKSLFLITLLFSSSVFAKRLELKKMAGTNALVKNLSKGELNIFDKKWDAKWYCNADTIANPEEMEAFEFGAAGFELAILCPSTLDGGENIVTIFSKSKEPRRKAVRPAESSSHITEKQLRDAVDSMLQQN